MKKKEKDGVLPERLVIDMLGDVPDLILPEGWIGVYHYSGAIIYLHRETRVVTWSRPYQIARETSLKKHNIPLMSIPCLHQKRAKERYTVNPEGKRCSSIKLNGPCTKMMRREPRNLDDVGMEQDSCNSGLDNASSSSILSPLTDASLNNSLESDTNGSNEMPSLIRDEKEFQRNNVLAPQEEEGPSKCGIVGMLQDVLEESAGQDNESSSNISLDHNGNIVKCSFPTSTSEMEVDENNNSVCPYSTNVSSESTVTALNGPDDDQLSESEEPLCNGTKSPECENVSIDSPSEALDESEQNQAEPKPAKPAKIDRLEDMNVEKENEVCPLALHKYMGSIFDFKPTSLNQLKHPIMSSEVQDEQEEEEVLEKKLVTKGKTPFQILNEYCQKEVKALPVLSKVERHSQHDFTVEILIKTMKFGIAAGDTLKEAKHSAASNTLNIFDYTVLNEEEPSAYLLVFDKIPSDDPSVIPTIDEFSAMGVKNPSEILMRFLSRQYNPDFKETELEFITTDNGQGKTNYNMKYKDIFEVSGECDASLPVREVASQAFINQMYPQLKNWGSVIRLWETYVNLLASRNLETHFKMMKPNKCIMHVLRQEMQKIAGNFCV